LKTTVCQHLLHLTDSAGRKNSSKSWITSLPTTHYASLNVVTISPATTVLQRSPHYLEARTHGILWLYPEKCHKKKGETKKTQGHKKHRTHRTKDRKKKNTDRTSRQKEKQRDERTDKNQTKTQTQNRETQKEEKKKKNTEREHMHRGRIEKNTRKQKSHRGQKKIDTDT